MKPTPASLDEIKEALNPSAIFRRPRHNFLRHILIGLVFLAIIVYFFPHPQVSHYNYEQGRPWNYAKLIAPFDIPIHPDSAWLQGALDSLDQAFIPVYARQHVNVDSIINVARKRMNSLPAQQTGTQTGTTDTRAFYNALSARLQQAYRRGVLEDSLPESLGVHHRAKARMRHGNMLQTTPIRGFITHNELMRQVDSLAAAYGCTRLLQNSGLNALTAPSVVCDVEESERILANDRALVTIDRGVIQRGQTIIDKGAVITAQDYTNLRTYEQMLQTQMSETQRSDILMLLGQILYVGLVLFLLMAYLFIYEYRTIWTNYRAVTFILSSVTLFFLITVGIDHTISSGIYLVPLAMVPVLVLVFFNGRVALATSVALILLCVGLSRFTLEFIVMQMCATSTAVFTIRELNQRSQLIRASVFIAVAYWLSYLSVQLLTNGSFDDFSWRVVTMLGINSLLTSLTYVMMFAVERVFGFVSNVTLVELADSNSPLLRQLSDVCPGTFQHSEAVSTLAADAARSIGANPQLVRAGAMYHDIGKMSNPIFFTENQHGVNPHDGLSPENSARIILSHVTEGIARADKAGLPEVIKDFIREHHGHGRAKYFYVTACKQAAEGEEVDPSKYTYPGPNPQTREASVLMMADSVEAASRSLKEHTPQAIRALVDKIVDSQLAEGLHNESTLSFRDISLIKKAFVKRLNTIYHSRIEYPEMDKAKAPQS